MVKIDKNGNAAHNLKTNQTQTTTTNKMRKNDDERKCITNKTGNRYLMKKKIMEIIKY